MKTLEATLESVAAQDYPLVEHIVVDGGSTDGTLDVLRSRPNVRWISEPDDGLSDAVNKGVAMATKAVMAGRIKAAVDARRDQSVMIMARSDRPAKGYSEAETLDLLAALSDAGADAFFVNGYTLDQQQRAKAALKKPLMIGSSGPAAEWHAKGVDMAFYHIDDIGIGAMYIALKELKAKGGPFDEAAKWRLPRDVAARVIDQPGWVDKAKRYGVIT